MWRQQRQIVHADGEAVGKPPGGAAVPKSPARQDILFVAEFKGADDMRLLSQIPFGRPQKNGNICIKHLRQLRHDTAKHVVHRDGGGNVACEDV
jgi:hypothetical protein